MPWITHIQYTNLERNLFPQLLITKNYEYYHKNRSYKYTFYNYLNTILCIGNNRHNGYSFRNLHDCSYFCVSLCIKEENHIFIVALTNIYGKLSLFDMYANILKFTCIYLCVLFEKFYVISVNMIVYYENTRITETS